MDIIQFSDARKKLSDVFDQVSRDRAPVEIHRRSKPSVVVMDKEEFDGVMETLHLLSSPNNAERLMQGIAEAEAGHLIDPETGERVTS